MQRLALALVLVGCAASPGRVSSSAVAQTPASNTPGAELGDSSQAAPAPNSSGSPREQEPPEPPAGVPMLPAVSVRSVGLHVGGGPNDAGGKEPFIKAIEQRFPDFLHCYRFISEPGKTGTFGIDLQVAREGGRAQVEQPRTALAGDEFRACMLTAFESIEFPAVKRATVVSYSLRFSLDS